MTPSNPSVSEFEKFKRDFGKVYASIEEEEYRLSVFLMNLAKITAHNADSTQTYTLAVTQFTDLTQEEFAGIYLQTRLNKKYTDESNFVTMRDTGKVGDVDWTA